MSKLFAGKSFDGPYYSVDSLKDKSGVYIVFCQGNSKVIYVGQSIKVKTRMKEHIADPDPCWRRNCAGTHLGLYKGGLTPFAKSVNALSSQLSAGRSPVYYVRYVSENQLDSLEKEIARKRSPACGERWG